MFMSSRVLKAMYRNITVDVTVLEKKFIIIIIIIINCKWVFTRW
jgi:hypothetical protein